METTVFDNFDKLYEVAKNPLRVIALEHHVYKVAERLAAEDTPYTGGYWESVVLGNGFVFELQTKEKFHLINENNFADEMTTSKVFSVAVFWIALSEFSFHLTENFPAEEQLIDAICFLHGEIHTYAEQYLTDEERSSFANIID